MGETNEPRTSKTLKELMESSYKLTDKVVSDLKAGLQRDFTIEQACHYARINVDTYYEWLKLSDEFAEEMAIAKTDFLRRAKKVLVDAIERGDGELALKVLERREKESYSTKTETEITGKDGGPILIGGNYAEWLKQQNKNKTIDQEEVN